MQPGFCNLLRDLEKPAVRFTKRLFICRSICFVLILAFICPKKGYFCATLTTLGRAVSYADYVIANVQFTAGDISVPGFDSPDNAAGHVFRHG